MVITPLWKELEEEVIPFSKTTGSELSDSDSCHNHINSVEWIQLRDSIVASCQLVPWTPKYPSYYYYYYYYYYYHYYYY